MKPGLILLALAGLLAVASSCTHIMVGESEANATHWGQVPAGHMSWFSVIVLVLVPAGIATRRMFDGGLSLSSAVRPQTAM